ncbi:hypothetical protein [Kolpuevirus frurule]|uniref:tRNA ligase phosphodiesterase domain-containing protein n=1 Tax=Kolpuevirus sp. 'frurule' TaxID=3028514 RepID=A0AAF0IMX6_9CAUD|nr:hypothetical protein [Kolpuevirus sp. 'frurule']
MDDYEYYGLFLTQGSKDILALWLFFNGYSPESELMKKRTGWYLDHCTLLHRSQLTWDNSNLHDFLIDKLHEDFEIKIIGIGISDKAMAFKVNIFPLVSVNKIPHITICTFNGGKPVDSNMITEWKDIEPITVEVKLEKR